MFITLMEKLYPQTSYQYHGTLLGLRGSGIENVRKYHRKFYKPQNIMIAVNGLVEEHDIFKCLKDTEEDILKKQKLSPIEPFQNPWKIEISKWDQIKDEVFKVEYPSDDESTGN